MSIRLVASGSPICKKYDYKTENIFGTNGQKTDASCKIINADKKPTTINDQPSAIKKIDDNKKTNYAPLQAHEFEN
jgi:hypothetical protein